MNSSQKVNRLKILSSILTQEYQLGLNDQSIELGIDNFIQNSYKDLDWIKEVYPLKSRKYKTLGIGERHIWVKNLLAKIFYEIKIIQDKITHELHLKNLPLETPLDQLPFMEKRNIVKLKIFTSFISLGFFLILFYFGFLMVEEAFVKNYTTGTVWDPPLWIPYSSMLIGSLLMILQYIAEIIKLFDEGDFK